MNKYTQNGPLFTVLASLGLLGGIVWVFSDTATAKNIKDIGFSFPSANDIYVHYFNPETKVQPPHIVHSVPKVVIDTALSTAEKKRIDSLKSKVHFLDNFTLSKDNTCLSKFFTSLAITTDSVVHIWYYGDSQIEGDRITQDLRNLMQAEFGGSGLGYIPFSDVATFRTIELKPDPAWIKLNCFTNKAPNDFGFAGKVFKFKATDSTNNANVGLWISSKQKYRSLYLLYGHTKGGKGTFTFKDSTQKNINIASASVVGKTELCSNPIYGNLQFTLPQGTPYYGFLMEGKNGIQVDNCGIRGHSGDGLKYISDNVLRTQAKQLNTRLVVFHFGNNMIPYLKSNKMDYFQKEFEDIFKRYRRLLPDASFLVISPGDMGMVVDEEEKSYPYIEDLVETLYQASKNTGCAFFDMYAFMQKSGGITGWEKKGWANLDGHLSPAGQWQFAKYLYSEIKHEYLIDKIINKTP